MNIYAKTPDVNSLSEALAVARDILARMKPWPEEILIGDPEEYDGRVIFHDDPDYVMPRQVYAKLRAIAGDIRYNLSLMRALPRMPDLMIVMGDAATWIWDDRIAYIPRDNPEPEGKS